MEQLIITIEGKSNTDLLMRLLKKFNFVKSVIRDTSTTSTSSVTAVTAVTPVASESESEPLVVSEVEPYNWINPSRQATDKEFEQMIAECEASPSLTAEDAKALTMKEIKEWRKNRK